MSFGVVGKKLGGIGAKNFKETFQKAVSRVKLGLFTAIVSESLQTTTCFLKIVGVYFKSDILFFIWESLDRKEFIFVLDFKAWCRVLF